MPYLRQFSVNDKFINRMTTHPEYKVLMYSGSSYINNDRYGGSDIPSGSISLYEINVDRSARGIPLIYPFIVKDGFFRSFRSVTQEEYDNTEYGAMITGSYPMTASITRELIPAAALPSATPGSTQGYFNARKRMIALRNTMDYYRDLSNAYHYADNYLTSKVNLINIPYIFYDSGIEKGTVNLKFYFTGSLMAEAKDSRHNGELISSMGPTSGSTVGVVLYNEGIILLTSSVSLNNLNVDTFEFDSLKREPSWLYFGAYTHGSSPLSLPSSTLYSLSFQGTSVVPTMTLFATTTEGELNNSQNPTWLSSSNGAWRDNVTVTSGSFVEPQELVIKNTVESQYCRFEDDFQKQTFISKVGIFDENKQLLGVAKVANPVLKKELDSYTFKLRIDF